MRILDGELILSPSDLTGFAACAHLTQLDLRAVRGEIAKPRREDPLLDVLVERGEAHEHQVLARADAEATTAGGGCEVTDLPGVVTVPRPDKSRADLDAAAAATRAAMHDGAAVIYQAAFVSGRWHGYADFLLRVDTPSALGPWSYEVADAKLARSVKAAAVLQCAAYTEWVAEIQGVVPEHLHVITGDGEKHPFRVADVAAYHRRLKADLEATVYRPTGEVGAPPDTYPDPVDHCRICAWNGPCYGQRKDDDHLSLVAFCGRQQTRRLVEHGITTRTQLAHATDADRPPRLAESTFANLCAQAEIQVRCEGAHPPLYDLLPVVWPGHPDGPDPEDPFADLRPRGLAALPAPSPGDVFFDLEGDPYVYPERGGIEYLFGVTLAPTDDPTDPTAEPEYRTFWAHDKAAEKAAFEHFIDLVVERRRTHPDMHVYHYAPHEPSAVRRLMGEHGTREQEVDDFLRRDVFVDLYAVVRHALRLGAESYSLKQVEKLCFERPHGEVMDAGGSIVAYERWLRDGDQQILHEIALYNKDDCDSTLHLRDWLEARRAEVEQRDGVEIPRPAPKDPETGDLDDELDHVDQVVEALTADVPFEPTLHTEEQQARWLLAQLLHWHRREEKPKWWMWFDRLRPDRTFDEYFNDRECIAGVAYDGVVDTVKSSQVHRFTFEPQDHRFSKGDNAFDPATEKRVGTVVEVGDDWITLKRATSTPAPVPEHLIPKEHYDAKAQKAALLEIGEWVAAHGIDAPGPHRAARDLLLRGGPRAGRSGAPLRHSGEEPVDAACRLVADLDGECLAIQGPPGTGKTYTGAHMVLALLAEGKRVGITAQSHAVISNFLEAVFHEADAQGMHVPAIQKADDDQHCGIDRVAQAASTAEVRDALDAGEAMLAAGTSWLWCHEQMRGAVDVLFVDEAGQRSLADVVAASVGARNLVLLGDPQQLAQVSQGSHPEGAEASALGHLLGEHPTMPAHLGLFLETTWRMHPAVCAFVSDVSYEGKLESRDGLELQIVEGTDLLGGAGLRYVPVAHAGNTTSSVEEAEVVADLVDGVLGRKWTDADGITHVLGEAHVLVVSPYNAQVAEIKKHVPSGVKVGTVDKFQGQEAPITIYSMASSTAEDAPRGMDFLYDLHRLNVAVSRARSISLVVCSPELQRVLCRTPIQLRLANAQCLVSELAGS